MIRVNLLQTTQEPEQRAVVQKATAATQTFLLTIVGIVAAVALLGADFYSARNQNQALAEQVQKEERLAREYAKLGEQRTRLQQQKQAIDDRINIIKQLRADQAGPVNLLSRINERLPGDVPFYLLLVKQKGNQVGIFGSSGAEDMITQFVHRMEQSKGAFSGVEVVTINPAKFSNRDKLVAHITEVLSEMEVQGFNLESLAGVTSEPGILTNGILFAIKCNFNPGAEGAAKPSVEVAAETRERPAIAALR